MTGSAMIGGRRSAKSVPPAWLAPIATGAVVVIVAIAVIGIAGGERSRPAAPALVFDAPAFRAEERAASAPLAVFDAPAFRAEERAATLP